MSHDLIRWINACEAFLLVWLWTTWAMVRFAGLASRVVAFSCVPIWCWISVGAWNALDKNLQFNGVASAGPLVLGLALVSVIFDLTRALYARHQGVPA